MGTYLSTPVTDKNVEAGESSKLAWGVVDMQGWRKSMEDAHVAHTSPDGQLGVFGVFDGHGGPEVARFCQLYLVSVLKQQETWNEPQQQQEESGSPESPQQSSPAEDGAPPSHPKDSGVGRALVEAFHALDRMIDDPSRRSELTQLCSVKPSAGEQHVATAIPQSPPSPAGASSKPESPPPPLPQSLEDPKPPSAEPTESSPSPLDGSEHETPPPTVTDPATDPPDDGESHDPIPPLPSSSSLSSQITDDPENGDKEDCQDSSVVPMEDGTAGIDPIEASDDVKADESSRSNESDEDDDSIEAVGKDEAALERESSDDDDDNDDVDEVIEEVHTPLDSPTNSSKVSIMFQRLLNMSNPTGQIVVQLTGQQAAAAAGGANSNAPASGAAIPSPSAAIPSLIRNGRLICNLPDHPIHAGATAIVAVLTGRTLTVANAGDSRAVLCRNGTAYPLSFDHKPLQERELSRIRSAGGFVNQFGRVNGNLNLSRSIGDLKYKQVPNIPPAEQMITAEPDIVQVELCDQDEFIILGCDGIWDCLSNEKAVAYIRSRIDIMPPTEIGIEVLNEIISEDPRATQGIGGDNMTLMIIDLQPATRSWRAAPATAASTPAIDASAAAPDLVPPSDGPDTTV